MVRFRIVRKKAKCISLSENAFSVIENAFSLKLWAIWSAQGRATKIPMLTGDSENTFPYSEDAFALHFGRLVTTRMHFHISKIDAFALTFRAA